MSGRGRPDAWKGGKGLKRKLTTRGPAARRARLTSGTMNLEWHQFARLGDFPRPSRSLGILMGKADDWNPPGLGKAGPGGVGIEGARENE